ncbi:MAG: hypothetical protein ACOH2N_06180 [Devosia sp.]|jgi:hypothetical protein
MIRSLAVIALLALGLNSAMAQDAAPVPAPAPADIAIEPAASIPATPKQTNLLTGFYATLAVIEICDINIPDDVSAGMAGDQKRLETSVGLDQASATEAYAKVKAEVTQTAPDCTQGSPDLASVDAVTAIYAKASAAAAPAQ